MKEAASLSEGKVILVGHSAVRRAVMGDDATRSSASREQLEAMAALVEESLSGGALGFSSSLGEGHTDGDGRPVPSRSPTFEELVALGKKRKIPVCEDLGSGCLTDLSASGVNEPTARDSLKAGVGIITFSGD